MRRLKKGFFFSLFVITALALMLMTFKLKREFNEKDRADIFKKRIEKTNMLIGDIESDLRTSLHTLGVRALWGAEQDIENYGYFDNASLRITELIINGTVNGRESLAMNASTLINWTTLINKIVEKFNINITFENISIEVEQINAWNVKVSLTTDVYITDFEELVKWKLRMKEFAIIDIAQHNFTDPIYYLGSKSNLPPGVEPYKNIIRKTPYRFFWLNDTQQIKVFPTNINVINLTDHIINQYYRESNLSPNYLMRLEGNIQASAIGIESFVNVLDPTKNNNNEIFKAACVQGADETCAVDYQFFYKDCTDSEQYQVWNVYNEKNKNKRRFMLNTTYLKYYNLSTINCTDASICYIP